MCGIVGYVGPKDCSEVLVNALTKLEYRGYDSAGIAVFDNGEIKTVKTKGKLQDLKDKLAEVGTPKGHVGIGHTRWATHGEPSDVNSHPHSVQGLQSFTTVLLKTIWSLKTSSSQREELF